MRVGGIEDSEGDAPRKLSFGQRVVLLLPRVGRDRDKQPINDWARKTFMKPEDPADAKKTEELPDSVEELEDLIKYADDKERAIAFIAAPVAAFIGFLVVHLLVVNDPAQHLRDGALNKAYVNPTLYDELLLVLLALALGALIAAALRKRLFMGLTIALYGLAIFNLHYWGFGIPFVLCGAWYLVRSYRMQQKLKAATGGVSRFSAKGNRGGGSRPGANKRYTPPSSSGRRVRPKPADQ